MMTIIGERLMSVGQLTKEFTITVTFNGDDFTMFLDRNAVASALKEKTTDKGSNMIQY